MEEIDLFNLETNYRRWLESASLRSLDVVLRLTTTELCARGLPVQAELENARRTIAFFLRSESRTPPRAASRDTSSP